MANNYKVIISFLVLFFGLSVLSLLPEWVFNFVPKLLAISLWFIVFVILAFKLAE